MRSGFKLLNLSCINVKEKNWILKTQICLNFLENKKYINHIDDYITNHIVDPIDIAPFLDLHQASLKERKIIYF